MGIRKEESWKRKQRGRIYKTYTYYPIFEWSSADIWDYIHLNKLPYCSLYDEGFHRIGCVICPFLSKKELERHKIRWPQFYRILDKYLDILWEHYKKTLIEQFFTEEEFKRWPLWKTKEERKQVSLF